MFVDALGGSGVITKVTSRELMESDRGAVRILVHGTWTDILPIEPPPPEPNWEVSDKLVNRLDKRVDLVSRNATNVM